MVKTGRKKPLAGVDGEPDVLDTQQKLDKALRSEKIRNLYKGEWEKYDYIKSRSEAEDALVRSLYYYGITTNEIPVIMEDCAIGKWREETKQYRELTITKAFKAYISDPTRFFYDNKFVPSKLSEEIQREHRFLATSENSDIWAYKPDKGIWEPDGKEKIGEIVKNKLEYQWKTHYSNETIMHIRVCNYVPLKQLGGPLNKVVCLNGVYDLETGELEDFSPEVYAVSRIPVKYDPDAECPTIEKFLTEVLEPDDIPKFYELAGYCLYKDYPIARIAIFYGEEGSNGKTTALKLITAFLGADNVSTVNLQSLVDEGFRSSNLFGKLANISGDLPSKPIADTGFLKKATGGDRITAEKKFRDPFDFYNYAKLLFSANEVPAPKYDTTGAFYRRMLLLHFPNYFPDGDPKTDQNLIDKLTTPEELSGLFNKATKALKELLERGKFHNEKPTDERRKQYMRESNQIQYFADEYLEQNLDPTHYVTNTAMYDHYVYVCKNIKKVPKASNVFSRELRRWIPYAYQTNTKIDGKTEKIWRGVNVNTKKLNEDYPADEPPKEPKQPEKPPQPKLETNDGDTDDTVDTDKSSYKHYTIENGKSPPNHNKTFNRIIRINRINSKYVPLQEKLDEALGHLSPDIDMTPEELAEATRIPLEGVKGLLKILERDGLAYQPRHGVWRPT